MAYMRMQAKYNGSYVAVKQLKSSDRIALGDFRTEMGTLRKLHHPNAVQFLGACTRQQPYLIVTELMSCSLATAFSLVYKLTLRRQVEIMLEFARAMAYMHSRQPVIIHRDLKPANIMVGGSSFMLADTPVLLHSAGTIKVADFGLSKTLPKRGSPHVVKVEVDKDGSSDISGEPTSMERYRLTGETGSYRYMAPEVFLHEPYNSKVDVYSFAMICYQLFEGRMPFEGTDPVQAAKHAAMDESRPVLDEMAPNVPQFECRQMLRNLLRKCWAHDPHNRPAFTEIITMLESVLERAGPRKPYSRVAAPGAADGCCSVQ